MSDTELLDSLSIIDDAIERVGAARLLLGEASRAKTTRIRKVDFQSAIDEANKLFIKLDDINKQLKSEFMSRHPATK